MYKIYTSKDVQKNLVMEYISNGSTSILIGYDIQYSPIFKDIFQYATTLNAHDPNIRVSINYKIVQFSKSISNFSICIVFLNLKSGALHKSRSLATVGSRINLKLWNISRKGNLKIVSNE